MTGDPHSDVGPDEQRWPLGISAASNLRDLGGLAAGEGIVTRWRWLYRGGIGAFDPEAKLVRLGLRSVVDLRMPAERDGCPVELPDGVNAHLFPLFETPEPQWIEPADQRPRATARRYFEMLEAAPRSLRRIVLLMGQSQPFPLLIHCSAGRDRTGIVVAALLSLVGVADEDIALDYALSQEAGATTDGLAHKATMTGLLDLVRREHGGMRSFLSHAAQLDEGQLDACRTQFTQR